MLHFTKSIWMMLLVILTAINETLYAKQLRCFLTLL